MIDKLIGEIAKQGFMGIFLAIVGYLYYRKDLSLTKERNERLTDLKEFSKQHTSLLVEVSKTLDELSGLIRQSGR